MQIVPLKMFSLFAWHEVEMLVCGSPYIDIDVLKRHTVYRNGLTGSHALAKSFFAALESFSQDERKLFLRYGVVRYGRSTLVQVGGCGVAWMAARD